MFMNKLSLAVASMLAIAVFVATLAVGRAGPPEGAVVARRAQAAKEKAAPKFVTLDLQAWANQALKEGPDVHNGNNLARLPTGKFTFEGTVFQVHEKMIHLQGQHAPDWPEKVKGIKVGSKFHELRMLHANQQAVANREEIGRYVVHFADGTEVRIPLIFGENIANWFSWPAERKRGAAATAAVVAWNGKNDSTDLNPGLELHLYSMTWKNPHPEKTVDTIDFISRNTLCDPFLVALTLETK